MTNQLSEIVQSASPAPSHILSVLCLLPLFAAFVVLFTPRQMVGLIRGFTVFAMAASFLWSLRLLGADYGSAKLQLAERYELVPQYGITVSVGVDGLSLWLVLLTTLLTPLATQLSWTHIRTKVKEYAISLLVLESAILGGFVALDLFVFYVCWELTLVPMLLIIGVWGGDQRFRAAVKFFLYTLVGSLLMLVAILYLAEQYREQTGHYSFELRDLKLLLLPTTTQLWLFSAFALAFAIKVPLVPLHTWLPEAYVQAPTGGTIMLSAVMVKLATYGFLRFAMPLFPSGSHRASSTLVMLAVVGIIYGAYCAWAQSDLKKLVAYSSISHLGFVMLGIYTVSSDGLRGSLLQMVNHGISTGALFMLVGAIHERRNTHELDDFGGLAKVMPNYALVFVIVALSSIGLPVTNGFIGELMVLAGAFVSETLGPNGPLSAAFAAFGLVMAAVYMLHAVLKLLWGPIKHAANAQLADLSRRESLVLLPLVALIFYIGLFPSHLLEPMSASVDRFAVEYMAKLRAGDQNPDARGLLEEDVDSRLLGSRHTDKPSRPL